MRIFSREGEAILRPRALLGYGRLYWEYQAVDRHPVLYSLFWEKSSVPASDAFLVGYCYLQTCVSRAACASAAETKWAQLMWWAELNNWGFLT